MTILHRTPVKATIFWPKIAYFQNRQLGLPNPNSPSWALGRQAMERGDESLAEDAMISYFNQNHLVMSSSGT